MAKTINLDHKIIKLSTQLKLEKFRLNFSRCAEDDIASLINGDTIHKNA